MQTRLRPGWRSWSATALMCVGTATAFMVGLAATPGFAKPPLGKEWPSSQWVSMDQIDHSAFDALLRKYLDFDGFVDYRVWKGTSADRSALQAYLVQLSRASRRQPAGREAQLAFWINACNAVTIEGILQVYPTTSIRNHTAKVFGYNIWKDLPLIVGDEAFSLDQMEHEILRKMDEPRIHFAIVCASIGCPRLRKEAYRPDRLETQLADNARDFFSRPQNLRVDARGRTLYLSSILDWFGSDFGRTIPERLASLKPYLPDAAGALAADPNVRVQYLEYDWSLNDQKTRPAQRN